MIRLWNIDLFSTNVSFFPQKEAVRLRALWIQTLDVVTFWPQPHQILFSFINQGTNEGCKDVFNCLVLSDSLNLCVCVCVSLGLGALQRGNALSAIWSSSWRTSSRWRSWWSTGRKQTKHAWWVLELQWSVHWLSPPVSDLLYVLLCFNAGVQVTLQQWLWYSTWLVS